jgi:hypothetical protein
MSWLACHYRHSGVFESYRCFGDLWIKSLSKAAAPLLSDESGLVTEAATVIAGKS